MNKMILFLKDWKKSSAVPDFKTTNTSFLRLSGVYKVMGVKNHLFLLALHDKSLQGVNPFSEDLTPIEKFKIIREVWANPWYYFREIARAPAKSGGAPIRLTANRGNIALFWSFYNHLTVLLIQPRQTGKSFNTDILMTGTINWHTRDTKVLLFTKDAALRDANIDRLKGISDTLPEYLRTMTKKDSDNKESLTIKAVNNEYITAVGQNSPAAAANVGRGHTLPIVQVDEIAHIKFIDVALKALLPATTTASDIARLANAPYGKVFTTTAAKLDTDSGKFVYNEFYMKGAAWSEKLFDAEDEKELHMLVRNSSVNDSLVIVLDFNHRQLGFTDEWLRDRIRESSSDKINAEIDYLNKWSRGSSSSPLSPDALKKIAASEIKDFRMEIDPFGYAVRWYIPEEEQERLKSESVILSLDTSDAVGKDEIGMTLLCPYSGRVLAAADINKTNLHTFNNWIFQWIKTYSKLVLMPERRSSAVTMIDYLIDMCLTEEIDPFRRIFNWVANDKVEDPKRYAEIDKPIRRRDLDVYVNYKKYFGFGTSGGGRTSRDILYSQGLVRAARFIGSTVHDSRLISQIGALTVKHGRIDHSSGLHDDLVISWLLAYYLISMGNNLEYYGIDSSRILTEVISDNKEQKDSVEDLQKEKEQKAIMENLNRELEELKNYSLSEIEMKIRLRKIGFLHNRLDTVYAKSFNLSSRIKEIQEISRVSKISKNAA